MRLHDQGCPFVRSTPRFPRGLAPPDPRYTTQARNEVERDASFMGAGPVIAGRQLEPSRPVGSTVEPVESTNPPRECSRRGVTVRGLVQVALRLRDEQPPDSRPRPLRLA